jgi:hypothetical protein
MFGFLASKAVVFVVLASVSSGGYFYVQSLRHQLQAAVEAQQKLEDAIKARDLVMKKQQEDMENIRKINIELNNKFNNAQKDVSDLQKKFRESNGKARNLSDMANKKPREIEERLNRGTKMALRCNELATGASLKSEDDKNTICPELVKSKKEVK